MFYNMVADESTRNVITPVRTTVRRVVYELVLKSYVLSHATDTHIANSKYSLKTQRSHSSNGVHFLPIAACCATNQIRTQVGLVNTEVSGAIELIGINYPTLINISRY